MEIDVDMLGTSVVLVVFGKGHGRLVIRKESHGVKLPGEELREEGTNPEALLGSMGNGDVFALRGGERNNFLLFSAPRNHSPVKHKCVPQDSMSILCHTPICICVPNQIVLHHSM